ncbi:PREDICTED: ras-related protein Rab-20-like isoform X2 [Priapulus caudatus]|uniref:Ras-related protein Rab-20-like isoform X2 n=1 Tax=Priapulus caudatus TaxID=37621 RepID=A0ABM1E8N9_PRICU|nr:PREDICTED: ras-related protein Rab-20-like isoform X2 [Priapulus caudatus]
MQAERKNKANLKVIILGEFNVGKTSLIKRYKEGKFDPQEEPTIGASFYLKRWGPHNVAIWDTAGQERFMSLSALYCRGTKAAILAFDISQKDTFNQLEKRFLPLVNSHTEENCLIVIVGCKVHRETAIALARELNPTWKPEKPPPYYETSSITGENVNALFEFIFEYFLPLSESEKNQYNQMNKRTKHSVRDGTVDLQSKSVSTKRKCCSLL